MSIPRKAAPANDDSVAGKMPTIQITTDMTAVVDKAQDALMTLPQAPVIFQRGHALCTIARGVKPPKWLHREPDAPIIQALKPARLMELMSRAAAWEKYNKRAKEWEDALPPRWAVETLHARPAWPFPVLEGIIGTPTLRPDGSVLDTPGYDESTGLYLDTQGVRFPPLLAKPTKDHAVKAVQAFRDLLQNFPFVGTGFAAALSALLSLECRFTVRGNVPLFAFRSTVRGSGKGLCIDTLSTTATGRKAPHWPQSANDEEDRKRLVTVGLAGDACIHIDNVKYPLGSPALDLALTTDAITDRLLGFNQQVTVPLTMVWFASGNNMQFQGDTARRVTPIDLDPETEKPEERTGFATPNLLAYVREHRPALAMQALTIIQAYCVAGQPPQGLTPYGSFQEWSDLIRSAVMWVTGEDPCAGRTDLEAQSDPDYERIASLLTCWHTCYKDAHTTVAEAVKTAQTEVKREENRERASRPPDEAFVPNPVAAQWRALAEALRAFDRKSSDIERMDARTIGNAFSGIEKRVVGGLRLQRSKTRSNGAYPWSVASVTSGTIPRPSHAEPTLPNSETEQENVPLVPLVLPDADSERPPGASPATFPPGRPLPDEAGEVLSRAPSEASERSERPLTGSPTRIASPSPGGNGAAGAGACPHTRWIANRHEVRCLSGCGATAALPLCLSCGREVLLSDPARGPFCPRHPAITIALAWSQPEGVPL